MRHYATVFHRFAGLVLAGLLLLAGVTGALLVWYHELDAALNPAVMKAAPPYAGAVALDPLVLRDRVLAANPGASVNLVELWRHPGESAKFTIERQVAGDTLYDEIFVHPYSGDVLGTRTLGELSSLLDVMPFIYELHYSLALGTIGTWAFGIAALLWTLDCFVGAYLTLPARRRHPQPGAGKGWLQRWLPAWKVRTDTQYKLTFDLHRAGGLWLWALLLVLAWSAVGFNLQQVYKPVMETLFVHQDEVARLPKKTPGGEAPMSWPLALQQGRLLMQAEARAQGLTVLNERLLSYDAKRGVYRYRVKSDRDLVGQKGNTSLYFDARSGERKALFVPTGRAAGDTVSTWLYGMHMAQAWGLWFRIFLTVTGLAVAVLCVTGVMVWLKKRAGRKAGARRAARASAGRPYPEALPAGLTQTHRAAQSG